MYFKKNFCVLKVCIHYLQAFAFLLGFILRLWLWKGIGRRPCAWCYIEVPHAYCKVRLYFVFQWRFRRTTKWKTWNEVNVNGKGGAWAVSWKQRWKWIHGWSEVQGRLFQIVGPAAVKDLSPIVFLPIRTTSRVLKVAYLVIGWESSDLRPIALFRYDGAHLLWHL